MNEHQVAWAIFIGLLCLWGIWGGLIYWLGLKLYK